MDLPLGQLAGRSLARNGQESLSLLMDEARPQPSAQWVIAEGADAGSYARSLPLQALRQHGMLALYQNGERLLPSQRLSNAAVRSRLGRKRQRQMVAPT
jgi:sulfane dehydrogenase subunit SoxC